VIVVKKLALGGDLFQEGHARQISCSLGQEMPKIRKNFSSAARRGADLTSLTWASDLKEQEYKFEKRTSPTNAALAGERPRNPVCCGYFELYACG
jgi:hypothetical protein